MHLMYRIDTPIKDRFPSIIQINTYSRGYMYKDKVSLELNFYVIFNLVMRL